MQDLVGRIRSLDPEASESLKVIGYFDQLLEGRVAVETLVRGAALLSQATVGCRSAAGNFRFAADGRRLESQAGDAIPFVARDAGPDAVVWIERPGAPHANDAMVLERLAHAFIITTAEGAKGQTLVQQSMQALLQPHGATAPEEAVAAISRLRLNPSSVYVVVATPGNTPGLRSRPSAVLTTNWGTVRATITESSDAVRGPAGVGVPVKPGELRQSWECALIALRINDGTGPLKASDLGSLLLLAKQADEGTSPPVDALSIQAALHSGWSEDELMALAEGASLRAVAAVRGLHHSTVDAKLPALSSCLGFEPRSPLGRTRLHVGLLLHRLMHRRFE